MLKTPMDILTQFPVRMNGKQKCDFRNAVRCYTESLGYPVTEENCEFGICNLIMGNPDDAKYLITAHYDLCIGDGSPAVVTLLEIARTLPLNRRHKVCFVLFDRAMVGLSGAVVYRKKHKTATDGQLVLHLDRVGDGDHLVMFPTKQLRKDRRKLTSLYKACGYFGKKSLLVQEKGVSVYSHDQNQFPYGVGICALRKKKKIMYMSCIGPGKDRVPDKTNVNILRAALTTFICCDEVN